MCRVVLSQQGKCVLDMARAFCANQPSPLTEASLRATVETLGNSFNLEHEKYEFIVRSLIAELGVTKELDVTLINKPTYGGQDPLWYTKFKKSTETPRANAYLGRLGRKAWSPNVIRQLDVSTDEIMNLLGDPRREAFDIRGLVMGEVQSGKTANYLALCNKSADAGYRVIIVTAGIIEKLRQQTQARLEDEFTTLIKDAQVPGLTTKECDFNNARTDTPVSFFRQDRPVLCVVKKNVTVLRHLYRWLQKDEKAEKLDYPLLFIDDEADNASINTASEEQAPTKTNAWIRKILNSFKRSSYLGITATPFANIFIDLESASSVHGEDLFPKSFVRRLTSPSNYCGAKEIFAPGNIYQKEISDLEPWLPSKHKKYANLTPQLPLSLKSAIGYFLLATAAMDILERRGYPITRHRTMLVHISRFVDIHTKLRVFINAFLEQIKVKVRNYATLTVAEADLHEEIRLLHDIWDGEQFEKRAEMPSWQEFFSKELLPAITPITVEVVNSKGNADTLNFIGAESVRAIVIGGNALSRGLTLEGLVVSYFKRNTMMSDTLLQMARWFGYRNSYQEYVRLWLEEDALDAFGYAMDVLDELSCQFDQMAQDGLTPNDFAFKLRTSPAALLPTARNKLRHTHTATLEVEMAIAGYTFETPRLPNDSILLTQNTEAVKRLFANIQSLSRDNGEWDRANNKVCYYRNVDAKIIGDFLEHFNTGKVSYYLTIEHLKEYITSESKCLDVMVRTGTKDCVVTGIQAPCADIYGSRRKVALNAYSNELQISGTKLKVASGGEMKYLLSKQDAELIASNTDVPYLEKAYEQQKNPLIIIHRIEASENVAGMKTNEFFALSIGIPGVRKGNNVHRFILSKTAYKEYFSESDEEEE